MDTSRAIIEHLMELSSPSREDLDRLKVDISSTLGMPRILGNSELIKAIRTGEERAKLMPILTRKKARVASGVVVIAAMMKPFPCPHGRCVYCPGGPEQGVPQSYTGYEPASMRGAQNGYEPFQQVQSRIRQLRSIGHEVDKVELVVMGGTFSAVPEGYQEWFIKGCLDGLLNEQTQTLYDSKVLCETSKIRDVGITVETRPDYAKEKEIDRFLDLGVTRVELGVQTLYDDIYNLVERGHHVSDVVESTRILRDAGLKVCYHMMPGLPGSNLERDLESFMRIFHEEDFRPDMLKIYPCLVTRGTKLYEWWKKGRFTALSTEQAVELIIKVKQMVPPWVRIMRIQRDIPANLIEAGVKKSNLRQLVADRLHESGKKCNCIRCREVGQKHLTEGTQLSPEDLKLTRETYRASEGVEEFLSVEDADKSVLVALLRLRIPSEHAHRIEIKDLDASLVRELHVYGTMVPVGEHCQNAWQHVGLGSMLLSEAEKISREVYDRKKVVVMSALGTKEYYRRLGYKSDGVYVSKEL